MIRGLMVVMLFLIHAFGRPLPQGLFIIILDYFGSKIRVSKGTFKRVFLDVQVCSLSYALSLNDYARLVRSIFISRAT